MEFQIDIIKKIQEIASTQLDILFEVITMSAEVPVIVVIAAIIYWCINKNAGQKLLLALIGNIALNTGIKETFKIDRPIGIEGIDSNRVHTAGGYSFPSGHTQTATTFWTSLMIIFKKLWIYIVGSMLVIGVGLSRIYLGVHWPTDIIGGWIIGILFTMFLIKVFSYSKEESTYVPLIILIIPFIVYAYFLNSESYTKMVGLFLGFVAGYIFEDRYINFDTIREYKINNRRNVFARNDDNLGAKMIKRFILGIITLGILYLGLDYIMPSGQLYSSFKYFIIIFYAVGIAPMLFKIFKLA